MNIDYEQETINLRHAQHKAWLEANEQRQAKRIEAAKLRDIHNTIQAIITNPTP